MHKYTALLCTHAIMIVQQFPFQCVFVPHPFGFIQASDPKFATQEMVYNDIGKEMLHHAFEG